ncbi:hypothetical protein GCM10023324_41890 [Streptomyces youssoufiensis]
MRAAPARGQGPQPYAAAPYGSRSVTPDRERARPNAHFGHTPPYASRVAHSPYSPHPTSDRVVGAYVHTYEPAPRDPYQPPIPSMRPPHEGPDHARPHQHVASATPIFDALYAEYRRSFRALPGDRSGEEDLGFTAFGHREQRGAWERPGGWERTGTWDGGGWSGHGRHQRTNLPAALPPAPRDGRRRGL